MADTATIQRLGGWKGHVQGSGRRRPDSRRRARGTGRHRKEITIEQIGSDVVVSGQGRLDDSGLTPNTAGGGFGVLFPSLGALSLGTPVNGYIGFTDFPAGALYASPLPAFGAGGFTSPTTTSGDYILIEAGLLGVPRDYVFGDPLSGSATFAGATLASLGVDPGHYEAVLANGETIGLTVVAPAPIPLPATLPLALAGAGVLVAAGRCRRRG